MEKHLYIIKNNIQYNCDYIKNRGLCLTTNKSFTPIYIGTEINAKNPHLFIYNGEIYILFQCMKNKLKTMAITKYNEYSPIFLSVDGKEKQDEKNWALLIKNNELYFVYKLYPLTILYLKKLNVYDKSSGVCQIIYSEAIDQNKYPKVRCGTNFIPFGHSTNNYISACYTKCFTNVLTQLTIFCMLDTNLWKIVCVSMPTQIQNEYSQIPLQFQKKQDNYYLSLLINNNTTLVYPVNFNTISLIPVNNIKVEDAISTYLSDLFFKYPPQESIMASNSRYNVLQFKPHYSKSFQDLFIVKILKEKMYGTFVIYGEYDQSDTYLLKYKYKWKQSEIGLSNVDYLLFNVDGTKALTSKYSVICLKYNKDMRKMLLNAGYLILFNNVCSVGGQKYDWFVNPQFVDINYVYDLFEHKDTDIRDALLV
jgi:hypothetical protein